MADLVESDQLLMDHVNDIRRLVLEQAGLEHAACELLRHGMKAAIEQAPWQWQWQGQEQPFLLKRFGSRPCGYALPSSDLDVVSSRGQMGTRIFRTLAAHCSLYSTTF